MSVTLIKVREDLLPLAPKRDYTLDAKTLAVDLSTGKLVTKEGEFVLTDWATTQLCGKLDIPTSYYKKCPNKLKGENATYWLAVYKGRNWFLRVADPDTCRAVLTILYTPVNHLDAIDILAMTLNTKHRDYDVAEYWHSDLALDLRILFPCEEETEDPVSWGFHLTNSEVGYRKLHVATVLYRRRTATGYILPIGSYGWINKKHMGIDKSYVNDLISASVDVAIDSGPGLVDKFRDTRSRAVTSDEMKTIVAARVFELRQGTDFTDLIHQYFLEAGGASLYDVINAISKAAQGLKPELRLKAEEISGRLILEGVV